MSEITCTSAATTFVNVSDDAEIRLIQVLVDSLVVQASSTTSDSTTGSTSTTTNTKIQQFNDACTKYINEGNIIMLLQTIVIDYNSTGNKSNNIKVLDTIVRMNNTNEAISCITILCALISKITSSSSSSTNKTATGTTTATSTTTASTATVTPITIQQQKTLTTSLRTSIVTSTAITNTTTTAGTSTSNTSMDTTIQQIATIERKIILLSILYNMSTKCNEKFTLLQTMYSLLIINTTDTTGNNKDTSTQHLISKILLHTDTTLGKLISIQRTTTGNSATNNAMDDYYMNTNDDTNTNTTTTTGTAVTTGGSTTATPAVVGTLLSTTIQSTTTTSLKPPIVYLLDLWNVSIIERRTMYNTIILALSSSNSSSSTTSTTSTSINLRKQQFLLLLVQTYTADLDSKTGIDSIGQNAVKLVTIGTINDPVSLFYQQRTLFELYSIQCILPKIDNGVLYKLLHIVLYGTVSDYEQFLVSSSNIPQLLTKNYNFNIELIRNYMKVLSFCTVASSRMNNNNSTKSTSSANGNGNEIMYNDIKTIINVTTDDEIERWIIAAVNCGLVQTKMDQLRKVVIVEKSSYRTLVSPITSMTPGGGGTSINEQQQEEWISIRQQLQQWQGNVNTIVSSLTTTSLNGTNSNSNNNNNTLPSQ